MNENRAQLSSYSNPKGRMLAVLTLFRHGGDIVLELHRSVAESTLKRLRMFVLRSKVSLQDCTAELPATGLIGDEGARRLEALGLPLPQEPMQSAARDGVTVIRRLGSTPRWSVHGEVPGLAALPPIGFEAWRRADLLAGVPTVYAESREMFVPQMANIDLLGGISFSKGCYTGQEIVARLHYLGQLKRRMFLLRAPVDARPGMAVYDAAGDGQAVGEVVDAVADGDATLLTAVLQLSHAGSDGLALAAIDGPRLGPAQALAPAGEKDTP
ncbi:CAF17-like 4Fe-4S cluster assembly/insertion protein YgfZ [Solimonas fluminis]|uniref:CAF17-like 4Fe-4S cluster assembly/insertion protein YgfZ n=1 Tax=Solimonas fluminis TaxID=2086571 RepID=UPI0010570852|nr:folate-binding protein YgfZ [Solimonas fluminis]